MARSDKKADSEYKNNHQREKYDRVAVLLPLGEKNRLKERLGGQSINGYIVELINKDMEGKND